jgi:tRNA-Thr(GGU) m(6)t(6)A37 methyltransferase TsaA
LLKFKSQVEIFTSNAMFCSSLLKEDLTMKTLTGQDDSYTMKPVAFVRCQSYYRYETPRQPEFSNIPAVIEFQKGQNFETALADLKGFERIWVIFVFHLNCRWSPKVRPPLSPNGAKYGLYATRSPHRPNRIGMSCVKLLDVDGTRLTIENSDMLDGTPVLDVKPYIPEVDSFPDSAAEWRDQLKEMEWHCAGIV